MPRPAKKIDYDDELMRTQAQIVKWTNTIKELEEERRVLMEQKERAIASRIVAAYRQSGLSPEEFIASL